MSESVAQALLPQIPDHWLGEPGIPVEVDLGCHKGTFLVEMARRHPNIRFLGIERQTSRVVKCLRKIDRLELANAFAIQREGLGELPLGNIRVIHVSFPDPWPKRRHWNRRLVNEEFLDAVCRMLAPGGLLRLMTDDEPYFRAMAAAAQRFAQLIAADWEDGREYPLTEFQKKFVAQDKPVYRLALCRSSNSE